MDFEKKNRIKSSNIIKIFYLLPAATAAWTSSSLETATLAITCPVNREVGAAILMWCIDARKIPDTREKLVKYELYTSWRRSHFHVLIANGRDGFSIDPIIDYLDPSGLVSSSLRTYRARRRYDENRREKKKKKKEDGRMWLSCLWGMQWSFVLQPLLESGLVECNSGKKEGCRDDKTKTKEATAQTRNTNAGKLWSCLQLLLLGFLRHRNQSASIYSLALQITRAGEQ